MSTQIEISIIIPTYNLEKYIGATLESVILQDGVTKEILVIDDSSTDKTREVIQIYASKYPYIKLLNNEKTKGVSGARNTGIAHMQGEKCFFLDGDDLLPPNALKSLATCMNENNATIVCGRLALLCHQRWICSIGKLPAPQQENTYPVGTFAQYLYNSAFIKSNSIFFPEGCSSGEDRVFFCQALFMLNSEQKIHAVDQLVYIYRINHKKTMPSAQQALSFMTHFTYIRNYMETHNKMHLYPSYIKSQFAKEWLGRAYYAQENDEIMSEYLKLSMKALSGLQSELSPILAEKLQEQTDAFWQACDNEDTQKLLEIVRKTNDFKPISVYMGVSKKHVNSPFWKVIRLLHRLRSILSNPQHLQYLTYPYKLQKQSKLFLKNNS